MSDQKPPASPPSTPSDPSPAPAPQPQPPALPPPDPRIVGTEYKGLTNLPGERRTIEKKG
jgi:hypothetical protein